MPRPFTRRALHALIPSGSAVALGLCIHTLCGAQSPAQTVPSAPAATLALAVAQEAPPLTLAQALAQAMASNAELAVLAREVEAVQGTVLQGGARPNPALSVLLEDTRRSTRTTTVQIDQPVEWGGQRAARIGAAERGRDLAAAELAAGRADIRAAVTATFHEVLLAQERVVLQRSAVDGARRASDAADKRVQVGKISPVEATKARIALATVQIDAAQADAELTLTRQRLAATWGGASSGFGRAEPVGTGGSGGTGTGTGNNFDSPVAPTAEAIAQRIGASPALLRARIEVQRREAISALARAEQTPDLTVSLGVKRDAELGLTQAVIGLAIPLPVFDRSQGKLLEALQREGKSRDELRAADIALRSSLLQSTVRLEAARAEVQMIRDQVLPGAQSAHDAAIKGFEWGKFSVLDVLDAQRTLFQARSQHLRARGDALRAAVEIDRLLGGTESPAVPPANPAPIQKPN